MFGTPINEKRIEIDWLLVASTFALVCVGVAFVCSATSASEAARDLPWIKQTYVRQIIFALAGAGAAVAISAIDYSILARWSTVIYWFMILLLVSVFVVGTTRLGATRWIDVGFGFNLQPSEFAKIAFILLQAHFLSRPIEELRMPEVIAVAIAMAVLPFVLILKEPDLGSALVFLPVSLVMMFVAGVPKQFLAKLVGGVSVLVILLVVAILFAPPQIKIVEPYQKERLLTYFGRDFAPKDASPEVRREKENLRRAKSWNVEQALISVGSGGLTGKGWRQGTQYALGFLPRAGAHNDFIFSVIAEEEGFVGSVGVLTLYIVLLFSGIKIASQARDRLGKLLAIGVVALFFSHVFVNIGMNIRMMPVTGIPLPLLSYGGSSVVCSLIAIGVLHNVHMHRRSY